MSKTVVEILEELESVSGSNAKTAILEQHRHNEILKRVFALTYDPYIVFYVTKVKPRKGTRYTVGGDVLDGRYSDKIVDDYLEMLTTMLATRQVTGNAAKKLVTDRLSMMNELEQKWCVRVLLRNLRCGVQSGLINKVWPNTIVPFSVQLAVTMKSDFVKGEGIKLLEKVNYPIRVEPKLDGLRCIVIKAAGEVSMFTRNGTPLESLPAIKEYLERRMPDNTVYDGEGMGRTFNESSSVMMSKTLKDDANMVFNVFDRLTLDEWKTQTCNTPLSERTATAGREIKSMMMLERGPVTAVHHIVAHNDQELLEFFAKSMEQGFEGVMLKVLDAVYEWDRSATVKKLKPFVTYEGVIVGWYEGRVGTAYEGLPRGFHVMLSNGIITKVGSGLKKVDLAQIQLEGPDTWLGKVLELEAQPDPLTPDGLTVDGRLRFPVYIRERSRTDVDPKTWVAGDKFLSENPTGFKRPNTDEGDDE